MNQKLLALACLAALALSACNKPNEAAPAPAETAKAAEPAPAPAAEPAPVAEAPKPGFDAAAFAGGFSGTLPCADCSGIDTKIEFKADGSYTIEESYQGKKDGNAKGDGNWTAEEDGKRLRLDPNSKSAADRLFEVVSHEEIRQLDQDGKAIDSQLNYSLKRASAAQ
ncbi:copper resistance protein NlpE [Lysobacter sp. ISL-50]|uniref:copper resistance protein NlpE n=1 Tax=unclassified Lysobacter TaxID=2635362 RepID=UPI001BEA0097|nr:copper resistance protein NlpE N-terminal domain-containing protein [Lysobacter sp. ISL-42]MBT2754333.1 copper resistance protein NlpE N-terminal domain-containing protein [Lysobacter sp. ISL-50]MBT2779885.1 copper resistance protein NlpE N-terminal domain-containing protein [Lysobacter sp. ISL-54]MBT2783051.1 copper resistance protein NlpE N-terminal domain-containing protein [Lysobacter sp. ISL-52]